MLIGEEDLYLTKMNHIKVIKTSHKLFKTRLNPRQKKRPFFTDLNRVFDFGI